MISIVIPVYNQATQLAKCLDSILAQSIIPSQTAILHDPAEKYVLEVIIVDDGSTDNVNYIAHIYKRKFLEREINLTIVNHEQNLGPQAARNRGAASSVGDFLLFCDADAVLRFDMLEKMLSALKYNPDASYAYSSFKWGPKLFKLWPFDAEKLKQMPYIHTTSLIRKAHFPGFDENIKRLQDWDLWLTMLSQGHTGVWINEILYTISAEGSTMSKWLPAFIYKLLPFLKTVRQYNQAVSAIKNKHQLG
jgi:glycosyltransferase involved in cell wall biosynthesis